MASVSRTAVFGKIHKVLKKSYKPSIPPADRTVLEHLLFACVLEDARYEQAEEAFAALKHTFYDWNEVRVTSISELSEVISVVPDPRAAANRVKRVLHGIFEELYCFDLEDKRKKNLGPTVKWLEKLDGASRFVVAYVVQAALGGHMVPVDSGTMAAFRVLDLVTEKEAAAGEVPGMERAVAKSKGMEFASLIHQLGADYLANPFATQVREILLAIDPEASKRFPQRRQARPEPAAPEPTRAAEAPAVSETSGRKKKGEAPASAPAKPDSQETVPGDSKSKEAKTAEGKKSAPGKKSAETAAAVEKHVEKHAEKPVGRPPKPEKPEKAEKPEKHARTEKPEREKADKAEKRAADPSKGATSAESLGKRKPR
jgi:endonuclease-3